MDNTTKRLYFQYREHEKIDDLATKQLTHYLREKKKETLKTGQRIFEIPFNHALSP
jgi:hypothetical protein